MFIIEVRCPHCGARYKSIGDETKEYHCEYCGTIFRLVEPSSPSEAKTSAVKCAECGKIFRADKEGDICSLCGVDLCDRCKDEGNETARRIVSERIGGKETLSELLFESRPLPDWDKWTITTDSIVCRRCEEKRDREARAHAEKGEVCPVCGEWYKDFCLGCGVGMGCKAPIHQYDRLYEDRDDVHYNVDEPPETDEGRYYMQCLQCGCAWVCANCVVVKHHLLGKDTLHCPKCGSELLANKWYKVDLV